MRNILATENGASILVLKKFTFPTGRNTNSNVFYTKTRKIQRPFRLSVMRTLQQILIKRVNSDNLETFQILVKSLAQNICEVVPYPKLEFYLFFSLSS